MIGRKRELGLLQECRDSDRSRLVIVYGRRRVGKTFLVREAFDYKFTFTHTGIENGTYAEQIGGFWNAMTEQLNLDEGRPRNWMEAFELLKKGLSRSTDERKSIFIDELPWMDTRRSGFVKAIASFWNGWASARKDIVMIVCGSAAAWMTKKILQNRGGLFNRANRTIYLEPFTLAECESYLAENNMPMSRKDITLAYMALGGAPYYWTLLERDKSLEQNFDMLFFSKNAPLALEFKRLYRSVFESPEPYIAVVSTLGTRKAGLTRDEIVQSTPNMGNDGTLTEILENLELSGFVRRYSATGKIKRESIFQLIDNYTLFYFQFIRDYAGKDEAHWSHMRQDQHRVAWEGLAFERICLQHTRQIKAALGISGVATEESAWMKRGDGNDCGGAQIDLVIRRGDRVTNLCEVKFASGEYEISSAYETVLRNKIETFRRETKTKDTLHLTFVTTYGLARNSHASIARSQITLDDLFK
jgi:AAA+ ATPase superfamily predicted ATPase